MFAAGVVVGVVAGALVAGVLLGTVMAYRIHQLQLQLAAAHRSAARRGRLDIYRPDLEDRLGGDLARQAAKRGRRP
jgi:hypothetical protein